MEFESGGRGASASARSGPRKQVRRVGGPRRSSGDAHGDPSRCSQLPCRGIIPRQGGGGAQWPQDRAGARCEVRQRGRGGVSWRAAGGARRQGAEPVQPTRRAGGALQRVEAGQTQEPLRPGFGDRRGGGGAHGDAEGFAAEGEQAPPVAVGEQPEVADADEAVGQDVEQETADEFESGQPQGLPAFGVGAVLGEEKDAVALEADETLVGDRDAVRVAAEVAEDVSGPAKGGLR